MCGRRSTTRTRLPNCVATRSAIVRPKKPEPTTKRSKRAVIGSKGIRPCWRPSNPQKAEGCDRLTIPYRHFSHSSHTSTVNHVTSWQGSQAYVPDVVHILRRLP